MALVECQQLHKQYQEKTGSKKADVIVTPVLKGIDLKIEQGEQVAILGHSGSGKSTLLHLLAMLDTPCEGKISIAGKDVKQMSENDKAEFRNENMGFIYQFHHLLPEFTALENVSLPMLISGIHSEEALEKSNYLLKKVNLNNRANHKPSELSGGERQRVAVARALSNSPSCLIMDEPTGDLDTYNALNIVETILELSQELKVSLIIATHDISLSSKMDRLFSL